ncbi:hypothetical protein B9Z55_025699 [Caenorhabditis nigoni]|uniref:Uncharacterized protein n=1 Tax=Caenorhabditis nigoni TaxID=1611254 RepID=A0A2G5T057_9PELO|nr:hypothetical protein B9Z55_025699 [Caenorhabditis nigoni]
MARTRVTTAQTQNAEAPVDIKTKIRILGEEYADAIKAHQSASNDVRSLQRQKDESLDSMQRLSYVKGMTKKAYETLRKQVKVQKMILENIDNQLKKAFEAEKLAKDDMEEKEADWKFEAMCSGEAYQQDGQWKWRQ